MPFLSRRPMLASEGFHATQPPSAAPPRPGERSAKGRARLLESCGNPHCSSGWLHLWRSRGVPVFEDRWTCSAECTADCVRVSVQRELDSRVGPTEPHRHRLPLGLLMLEQGWITARQLRSAVENQRSHGAGKIGQWLMAREGVSEMAVTRALGLQWSCPVVPVPSYDAGAIAPVLPRFFVDAFGAVPLRLAGGRVLYLGFEDRPNPVLALALGRIAGIQVESAIVPGSQYAPIHTRLLDATFPPAELIEASSQNVLVRTLVRRIEQVRPVEARLVRVHDCLWLRLWLAPQTGPIAEPDSVRDIISTISSF